MGGRISDRVGRTPVFLVSCACTCIGVALAALSTRDLVGGPEVAYYFVSYLFLGLGDSGFNTQVQGAIGMYYPENSQPAFAAYRFLLSVSATAGSVGGFYLKEKSILISASVLWAVLLMAFVGWCVLDCRIAPVSETKRVKSTQRFPQNQE